MYSLFLTYSETFFRRSNYCLNFLVLPSNIILMKSVWLSLDYLLELSWRADAKSPQYVTG